jgi:hypothetical protein
MRLANSLESLYANVFHSAALVVLLCAGIRPIVFQEISLPRATCSFVLDRSLGWLLSI